MKEKHKELRKLSRTHLLEIMLQQAQELDDARSQLAEAEEKLNDRLLHMQEAGSIAEASLQVSGIFEVAQAAADQYLENIRQLTHNREHLVSDARAAAEQILQDATARADSIVQDALRQSQDIQAESQAYWDSISKRLRNFYGGCMPAENIVPNAFTAPAAPAVAPAAAPAVAPAAVSM